MKEFALPLGLIALVLLLVIANYGGTGFIKDLFKKEKIVEQPKPQKKPSNKEKAKKLLKKINLHIENANFDQALTNLDSLEKIIGKKDFSTNLRGICFSGKGDFQNSLLTFKTLLNKEPQNIKYLITVGRLYSILGNNKKAIKTFLAIPQESSRYREILPDLAQAYFQVGKNEKAVPLLKSLIKRGNRKMQENYLKQILSAVYRPGDLNDLKKTFHDWYKSTGNTFFLFATAEVEYALGNDKIALKIFNEALRKEKKNNFIRLRMALIIYNQNGLKSASKMFRKIMGLYPKFSNIYWKLGQFNALRTDLKPLESKTMAFEFMVTALIENKDFLSRDDHGILSWGRKYYLKKLRANKNNVTARFYIALLAYMDRDIKTSRTEFKRLLSNRKFKGYKKRIVKNYYQQILQRDREIMERRLAQKKQEQIALQWNKYNQRLAENRRRRLALTKGGKGTTPGMEEKLLARVNKNPRDPRALYQLGLYYAEHGKEDEGLQQLKNAERIDPTSPHLPFVMGKIELSRGIKNNAMDHFNRALKKSPTHGPTLYCLSKIHFDSGDMEKAMTYIERSLSNEPLNIEGHLLLGKIYRKNGEMEKARKAFNTVISLNESSEEAQKARSYLSN
ncbi:tetratricopeptide repeat protein [Candidatus Riflebacteria bacterium]